VAAEDSSEGARRCGLRLGLGAGVTGEPVSGGRARFRRVGEACCGALVVQDEKGLLPRSMRGGSEATRRRPPPPTASLLQRGRLGVEAAEPGRPKGPRGVVRPPEPVELRLKLLGGGLLQLRALP